MPEESEGVWWHLLSVCVPFSKLTVRAENQGAGPRHLALGPTSLLSWEGWQDSGQSCLGAPSLGALGLLNEVAQAITRAVLLCQKLVLSSGLLGLEVGPVSAVSLSPLPLQTLSCFCATQG